MMKKSALIAFAILIGCTTGNQPAATPAKPASQFKNLQVFPQDIPREQLINTMRGFTRALGTRCNFCHVVTKSEPEVEFDFASDAKDEKRNARTMIRMVHAINGQYLTKLETEGGEEKPQIGCWTCHRGKQQPEEPPPPPAENKH
jgi:photosynthetic reaction center cytochrome c subunit